MSEEIDFTPSDEDTHEKQEFVFRVPESGYFDYNGVIIKLNHGESYTKEQLDELAKIAKEKT